MRACVCVYTHVSSRDVFACRGARLWARTPQRDVCVYTHNLDDRHGGFICWCFFPSPGPEDEDAVHLMYRGQDPARFQPLPGRPQEQPHGGACLER